MSVLSSSTAGNSFAQAEQRFHELRAEHEAGRLDTTAFQFEVAKLLLRDEQGVFWMLDANTGQWFCNRGGGWRPGDPAVDAGPAGAQALPGGASTRRAWRWAMVGIAAALVVLTAGAALWRWPAAPWRAATAAPAADQVEVIIASPGEGSQVVAGQEVAVESTIRAGAGSPLAWVELYAGGQLVDRRAIQTTAAQPMFLSQLWQPGAVGPVPLSVAAIGADGHRLGAASVNVQVMPATSGALPGPDCTPAATLVGGVTIPAGMVFPSGARMDKVWQVKNSGTCAWTAGYELAFVAGQKMGAPTAAGVPAVPTGGQADLPVTFWAPVAGGVYTSAWQLRSPGGVFFGPVLTLTVEVRPEARPRLAPAAAANLQAVLAEGGRAVRLSWEDRSNDEDAFRIYRQDVEASVGLAPANALSFVDDRVACGQTYSYIVVAFNASGASPSEPAEASLPDCPPASDPPSLVLSVTPADIQPSGVFTVSFEAGDDLGVAEVRLWGEGTGDGAIDGGWVITCTDVLCTGAWRLTWTGAASATLTIAGVAVDASGQESSRATITVDVHPR